MKNIIEKEYVIGKVKEPIDDKTWAQISKIDINCFPWDKNGYRPITYATLCYTDIALHIRFKAYETMIEAQYVKYCDPVCRDSCVEFFFNATPGRNNKYFNFEINAIGTLLLGLGSDRNGRRLLHEVEPKLFGIKAIVQKHEIESFTDPAWTIEYTIPFDFLKLYFRDLDINPGAKMKGNLYKCGDNTRLPHYGCWNPIAAENPDFHRPEYFGNLIFG